MAGNNTFYNEILTDHNMNPVHKHTIEGANMELEGVNPSCGDDMNVEVKIEDGIVKEVYHDGHGCSICCSSASVMSETITGRKVSEAKALCQDFFDMVKGEDPKYEEELGEAIAYMGVRDFPARIKCATLAWKAVEQAINEVMEDGNK